MNMIHDDQSASTSRVNHAGVKHGKSKTPEYRIWCGMRQRCQNPRHEKWPDYGERGIQVCNRWQYFANFYTDLGPRPDLGYSIDRIDNDGNYEPGNCRWATPLEQRHNQRARGIAALPRWCRHGHAYVEGSYRIDQRGARQCLVCAREVSRRAAERQCTCRHSISTHPLGNCAHGGCECQVFVSRASTSVTVRQRLRLTQQDLDLAYQRGFDACQAQQAERHEDRVVRVLRIIDANADDVGQLRAAVIRVLNQGAPE